MGAGALASARTGLIKAYFQVGIGPVRVLAINMQYLPEVNIPKNEKDRFLTDSVLNNK